jgi:hypothetical protein
MKFRQSRVRLPKDISVPCPVKGCQFSGFPYCYRHRSLKLRQGDEVTNGLKIGIVTAESERGTIVVNWKNELGEFIGNKVEYIKDLKRTEKEKLICKICGSSSYISKDGDVRLLCKHGKEGLGD